MNELAAITALAKIDSGSASSELETRLLDWFPTLRLSAVQIRPSAVSLNSVNGTLNLDGKEHYFKFHAESGEETGMDEYYRSELLLAAGWPMLEAVFCSREPGRQFLIYPQIESPTLYDVLLEQDSRFAAQGSYDDEVVNQVLLAERQDNEAKAERLICSLRIADRSAVIAGPLNQLFYRRLVNPASEPRVDSFYTGKQVRLPGGESLNFDDLSHLQWVINGVAFSESLAEQIDAAKYWLNPGRLERYPVVTGHGDEHNGNKFLTPSGLLYFDAAFADHNQYALLCLIKTTFHDTLAHPFWLYEPARLELELTYQIRGDRIEVNSNYDWARMAPLRSQLLATKLETLWVPLLRALREQGSLEPGYLAFIRSALLACPLLVYNLLDPARYTPAHSLLALSECVRLGSPSTEGEFNPVIAGLISLNAGELS